MHPTPVAPPHSTPPHPGSLTALLQLGEALDAVTDRALLADVLLTWGALHLEATEARVCSGSQIPRTLAALDPSALTLVERPGPASDSVQLSAPVRTPDPAWLTFVLPALGATDTVRNLVTVAGRLCASTLARLPAAPPPGGAPRASRRASPAARGRIFLGSSSAASEVVKLVARLATSDTVVLLEGETGVGKTFLARALHQSGDRASAPLRIINCAAIPETLVESELFGHERGAFTGASTSRAGALEAAGRGTVLLDEIGELPLASQTKLLRVLEERRFERLGSNRAIPLEARVLVATNRDLRGMVASGAFRSDLFYRIAVVKLRVPALRERLADLPLLAAEILEDLESTSGRRVRGFSAEALEVVQRYAWPGNVRELRNAIEHALVVGEGLWIQKEHLPEVVRGTEPAAQPIDEALVRLPLDLQSLEQRAIHAALRATSGHKRRAAALLGISRVTLHRKMRGERSAQASG